MVQTAELLIIGPRIAGSEVGRAECGLLAKRSVCAHFKKILVCASINAWWIMLSFDCDYCCFLKRLSHCWVYHQRGLKLPPPPPPLQWLKTHTQCFTSQGSKSYIVWRWTERGGRGGFHTILSIFFCLLEKKTQGHFLTQKESACQISVDSEQLEKLQQNRVGTYASLPWSPSILLSKIAHPVLVSEVSVRFRGVSGDTDFDEFCDRDCGTVKSPSQIGELSP